MSREPLYPHTPKKKEPLFPHMPKGRLEKLPQTSERIKIIDARGMSLSEINKILRQHPASLYRQIGTVHIHKLTTEADIREFRKRAIEAGAVAIIIQEYGQYAYIPISPKPSYLKEQPLKHYWIEKNVPYDTWAVVEAFPGGVVRSPYVSKEEAIKKEDDIAQYYGWKFQRVDSPQEKFPKQHEALKKLYPYEFVEYHDDGDLTLQLLIPLPKPQVGFKKGDLVVVTTDGSTFREITPLTTNLWAKTEGDPIRKFCCRQCGECAPKELLEEGRFLDRISWLWSHYKDKHPGMWGKISPMTVEDGEPLSPEYHHLVSLISEPLPKEAE